MTAHSVSREEIRKAYERVVRERNWWGETAFELSETGDFYRSPWVQSGYVDFEAGYLAASDGKEKP
jgi:hypothetical protein